MHKNRLYKNKIMSLLLKRKYRKRKIGKTIECFLPVDVRLYYKPSLFHIFLLYSSAKMWNAIIFIFYVTLVRSLGIRLHKTTEHTKKVFGILLSVLPT